MIKRHDSLIVQTMTRFLTPIVQLFALYVYFHGHYSPGGGFQAGVMIGASFVLEFLVGSKSELKHFSITREFQLAALGLGVYAVIGGLSLCYAGHYLDYGVLKFLGTDPAMRRHWGILIAEGGVTIVVAMTTVVIFHVLAFLPERNRS